MSFYFFFFVGMIFLIPGIFLRNTEGIGFGILSTLFSLVLYFIVMFKLQPYLDLCNNSEYEKTALCMCLSKSNNIVTQERCTDTFGKIRTLDKLN